VTLRSDTMQFVSNMYVTVVYYVMHMSLSDAN